MIVPRHWSQCVVKDLVQGRKAAVFRFGWSNESPDAARAHAETRAWSAMRQLQAGEKVARREYKVPYNGAEGVPIREEIISEHQDVIVTRNSYGARCLNTPHVLFADVDLSSPPLPGQGRFVASLVVLTSLLFGIPMQSWPWAAAAALGALMLSFPLWRLLNAHHQRQRHSNRSSALDRVRTFAASHPHWLIRIYESPSGLRIAVTHRLFQPSDPEVKTFFEAIQADPVYVRMCLRQQCFRARLTAKPWRVGIERHIKPYPGVWPINPQRLPDRKRWVDHYESVSLSYAACRFQEQLGQGSVESRAWEVVRMHDEWCRATSSLPLA